MAHTLDLASAAARRRSSLRSVTPRLAPVFSPVSVSGLRVILVTDPFGAAGTAEWSLQAMGIASIAAGFLESGPTIEWTTSGSR